MPLFRGSRYEGVTYIGIKENDGSMKRFLDARLPLDSNNLVGETQRHVVKAGETLDYLAFRYYGDETKWWLIAEVNGIEFAFDEVKLQPGTLVQIPDKINLDQLPRLGGR